MTDTPQRLPLFLPDKQIAQLLGIGEKTWRAVAQQLERQGLPKPDPSFANRRYWPAVRAFLDRRYHLDATGIRIGPSSTKVEIGEWNDTD